MNLHREMSGRPRILFNLGSVAVANALGKLLWSLSLVLIMRALGPEAYGRLVVIWSIAGVLAPLTDLGLSQLLLREGARDPRKIHRLLILSLSARTLLGLGAVAILVVASWLGLGTLGVMGAGVVALAAAAPLLDGFFLSATALAQAEGCIRLLSVWRVVSFAAIPMMLLAFYEFVPALLGSALAYVLASVLGLTGFFLMRKVRTVGAIAPIRFREALAQSAPFLFMSVAAFSYGRVEVTVLGLWGKATDAAFYHAAYQVILLVFSMSEVFFTVVFADLYRANAEAPMLAARWPLISRFLCVITVLSLPPLWCYADQVMSLLGGQHFANAGAVLRALLPMLAALPLAAAMNFLMLLNQPGMRAAIDAVCVVTTGLVVAMLGRYFGAEVFAIVASVVYVACCSVAWLLAARIGLRLRWAADLARAFAVTAPVTLIFVLNWPHWLYGIAAYVCIVGLLLYVLRYLRPSYFDKLET